MKNLESLKKKWSSVVNDESYSGFTAGERQKTRDLFRQEILSQDPDWKKLQTVEAKRHAEKRIFGSEPVARIEKQVRQEKKGKEAITPKNSFQKGYQRTSQMQAAKAIGYKSDQYSDTGEDSEVENYLGVSFSPQAAKEELIATVAQNMDAAAIAGGAIAGKVVNKFIPSLISQSASAAEKAALNRAAREGIPVGKSQALAKAAEKGLNREQTKRAVKEAVRVEQGIKNLAKKNARPVAKKQAYGHGALRGGLIGYGAGAAQGGAVSALDQYNQTGEVDWLKVIDDARTGGSVGALLGGGFGAIGGRMSNSRTALPNDKVEIVTPLPNDKVEILPRPVEPVPVRPIPARNIGSFGRKDPNAPISEFDPLTNNPIPDLVQEIPTPLAPPAIARANPLANQQGRSLPPAPPQLAPPPGTSERGSGFPSRSGQQPKQAIPAETAQLGSVKMSLVVPDSQASKVKAPDAATIEKARIAEQQKSDETFARVVGGKLDALETKRKALVDEQNYLAKIIESSPDEAARAYAVAAMKENSNGIKKVYGEIESLNKAVQARNVRLGKKKIDSQSTDIDRPLPVVPVEPDAVKSPKFQPPTRGKGRASVKASGDIGNASIALSEFVSHPDLPVARVDRMSISQLREYIDNKVSGDSRADAMRLVDDLEVSRIEQRKLRMSDSERQLHEAKEIGDHETVAYLDEEKGYHHAYRAFGKILKAAKKQVKSGKGLDVAISKAVADAKKGSPLSGDVGGYYLKHLDELHDAHKVEQARKNIAKRNKGTKLRISVNNDDFADLADYVTIGASYIRKGISKPAEWGAKMIAEFGEAIKPHILKVWDRIQSIAKDEKGASLGIAEVNDALASGYDIVTKAPNKAIGKVFPSWLDADGKAAWPQKLSDWYNEHMPALMTLDSKTPQDMKFRAFRENIEMMMRGEESVNADMIRTVRRLSPEVDKKLYDAYTRGTATPAEVVALKKDIADRLLAYGEALKKVGIITDESFDLWKNNYLRRVYEKKLKLPTPSAFRKWITSPSAVVKAKGAPDRPVVRAQDVDAIENGTMPIYDIEGKRLTRADGARWQRWTKTNLADGSDVYVMRRDWTEDELAKFGEYHSMDVALPVTLANQASLLKAGRLYKGIADNPEWSKKHEFPESVKLQGDRWGLLNGRYVRKDIADYLTYIYEPESTFTKYWGIQMRVHKLAMTAYDYTSMPLNYLSNSIMYILKQGNPFRAVGHHADYFKSKYGEVTGKKELISPEYALAKKYGMSEDAFVQSELMGPQGKYIGDPMKLLKVSQLLTEAQKRGTGAVLAEIGRIAQDSHEGVLSYHHHADVSWRFALFTDLVKQGVPPERAAKMAKETFGDYRSLTNPILGWMRKYTHPFIGYTALTMPQIFKAAGENMLIAGGVFATMNWMSRIWSANDPKLEEAERAGMKYYDKGNTIFGVPKAMRIPYGDGSHRGKYLSIQRMIPMGNPIDSSDGTAIPGFPDVLTPSGPVMNIAGLFRDDKGALLNMENPNNEFRKVPITNPKDSFAKQAFSIGKHITQPYIPRKIGRDIPALIEAYTSPETSYLTKEEARQRMMAMRTYDPYAYRGSNQ